MSPNEVAEAIAAIVLVGYLIDLAVFRRRRRKPAGVTGLSAPYKRQIVLTPYVLTKVNEARQRFRAPMLSEIGFRNAIAAAADERVASRPRNIIDLLTYLIIFELADKHPMYQSNDVAGNCAFTVYVRPDEYNFGMGAAPSATVGRSSHWSCRDETPAREMAKEITFTTPVRDVYADLAASLYQ